MQAHRKSADWPTFEVSYQVTVKAKDREAAKRAFYRFVSDAEEEGLNWEVVSNDGFQKVVALPKENHIDPSTNIRVTKKEKGVT